MSAWGTAQLATSKRRAERAFLRARNSTDPLERGFALGQAQSALDAYLGVSAGKRDEWAMGFAMQIDAMLGYPYNASVTGAA